MIGETYEKKVSAYNPSQEVKDFTMDVKKEYTNAYEILHTPYTELNDLSVIERDNRDRLTFNAFVDESVEDPAEKWKWIGTRSKARNKAIALHAQLTSGYIVPMFMAQNDADEEDRGFSEVMRDIAEWMVHNSPYKTSYLMAAMSMLVSPVVYLGAEYRQVYQKIKTKTEKGFAMEEVLDEVLSGFDAPVHSCDQVLITNAYEQNIQRQRCIFKERWIDYGEAETLYGEHENWNFVLPGVNTIFNEDDTLFYDVKDDNHEYLVKETTYYNRLDDTQVCFLGGVYMGDRNVEENMIQHRDNRNAPKYNVVPFGYQRITEHFFYYKSLMNSQYWDNLLLDAQYQVGMDRAFLDTNMPIAISGSDKVDSEIIFPSSVVSFKDPNTVVRPLLPQANMGNMFSAMNAVESSMDESSVSDTSSGQLPDAAQKATAIAIAERNAKILLQGVGKSLAESIVQYGRLMADIAINHLTIPQIDQIVGDTTRMKYRSFVLKDKSVGGKQMSKVIRFDEEMLGMELSDEQVVERNKTLAIESGYPDNKESIYVVNPEMFSRMKYLVRVEPETMFPKNKEFMQAMHTQLLAQMANNPYVSLEALTRKVLYDYFDGEADDIMQKPQQQQPIDIPSTQAGGQASAIAVGNKLAGAGVG